MFTAIQYFSGIASIFSLVAFLVYVVLMLARSGAAKRMNDPEVLRELSRFNLDPRHVQSLSASKIKLLVASREGFNQTVAKDIVAATSRAHYRFLTVVSLAITLAAAGIFALSMIYSPVPDPPATASVDIHPVVQFRVWRGFTDNEGREIPRADRFAGPAGLILTPLINNEVTPAQSLFVENITLEVAGKGWEMDLEPRFITNIHPEIDTGKWLSIVDDFIAFSIPNGERWTKDLAFKAIDGTSFDKFLAHAEASQDHNLSLLVTVRLRDDRSLKALCRVSGQALWADIKKVIDEEGVVPSLSETACRQEAVK